MNEIAIAERIRRAAEELNEALTAAYEAGLNVYWSKNNYEPPARNALQRMAAQSRRFGEEGDQLIEVTSIKRFTDESF